MRGYTAPRSEATAVASPMAPLHQHQTQSGLSLAGLHPAAKMPPTTAPIATPSAVSRRDAFWSARFSSSRASASNLRPKLPSSWSFATGRLVSDSSSAVPTGRNLPTRLKGQCSNFNMDPEGSCFHAPSWPDKLTVSRPVGQAVDHARGYHCLTAKNTGSGFRKGAVTTKMQSALRTPQALRAPPEVRARGGTSVRRATGSPRNAGDRA